MFAFADETLTRTDFQSMSKIIKNRQKNYTYVVQVFDLGFRAIVGILADARRVQVSRSDYLRKRKMYIFLHYTFTANRST